jgi:hypothetical protein
MVITLTKEAKDWLAIHSGIGNCFSHTGVSYVIWNRTTSTFDTHIGSTGDVVNAFWASHAVGRDADAIIASTNYTQFKAINGGTDIGFDDVDFAYSNDGTTSGISAYCYVAPPANVVSATLTVDKTSCTEPCTVGGTVSWTNSGGTASVPIDLKVTVNGGTPTTVATGLTINPGTTTDVYPFSLAGLAAGSYTICALPDSGTTCKVVTVHTPANVISATLTTDKTDCTEPCTVGGTVSWTNNGGTASAATDLKVTVNGGTPTTVATGVTINPGTTTDVYPFSLAGLAAGSYSICALPDSGTTCIVVTVKTPADIVATAITPAITTCVAPCGTTVDITWTNNGGTTGDFVPKITVNGTETPAASESLGAGLSVTKTFTLTNLLAGTITICAIPNTFPCATITVTAPVSSASFTSVPTGALVYVDNRETSSGVTGDTPVIVQNLSVGPHTYRLVTAECYSEATGEFTTVADTETPVSVTFDTAAHFVSVPDGARIWIDDIDKGVDAPHDVTDLTVGEHTYILKKPGYAEATGQFTTTLCQLTDIPPVNLSQVAEAGFGPFLIGGLVIGALFMGKGKSSDVGRKGKIDSFTIKQKIRESPTRESPTRESPTRESPTRESPTQMSKTKSAQVSRSNITNN